MARGSADAQQASKTGLDFATSLGGDAGSLYSTLAPELATASAHPQGFAPTDLAAMDTAGQQSAGGSNSGAVGEGALLASRTRNAGGADAAVQQSARGANETLSKGALGTRMANAQLKENQQQEARKGMAGLFSTSVGGANQALGEVANNVQADNERRKQGFWNSFTSGLGSGLAGGLTGGLSKLTKGFA